MRLYKPKDVLKQHRNLVDSPSRPLSSSPSGIPNPHRLKRAAEAVSKQLSGHKAMVAQFKEMKLPRPPTRIFASKAAATTPQTDRSAPAKQTKSTKAPSPTSSISPRQRSSSSGLHSNSLSPTRPPGLGSATKKHSTLLPAAAGKPKSSVTSQIRLQPQPQTLRALPATSPTVLASTAADITTSASDDVNLDGPILFVPCFYSVEDDTEPDDDIFGHTEPSSESTDFEAQVAKIFGKGLGPDHETLRRGEMAPPKVTPEATFTSTMDLMSAVVEWWEPVDSKAAQCKSKERSDISETTPPSQTEFVCVPEDLPARQPLSTADYEYVTSLGRDGFRTLSLCIHKQSLRKCLVKTVSNSIVGEEHILRALLEEQRIMHEASGYPFLLGLMASFHDINGFHLVSVSFSFFLLGDNKVVILTRSDFQEYCRSTLFDGRDRLSESHRMLAAAELVSTRPPSRVTRVLKLVPHWQACAVNHLHNLGIIHRDIKLENVMLKDGHVVLGDFDLALRVGASHLLAPRDGGSVQVHKNRALKPRGVSGTLPYMAPELLRNMEYSFGVDWFAYGVFLHVFYMDTVRALFLWKCRCSCLV
jgi:hypothetical protein